eukprot:m.191833 g.191833  ORF g.191833 m.191833 type:complete len:131 (+) comp39453_c0_seq50:231-623(+)
MGDDLPNEYDAIILGTGKKCSLYKLLSIWRPSLPQRWLVQVKKSFTLTGKYCRSSFAVLAQALALNVSTNGFYGGNWATFNWKEFEEWIDNGRRSTEEEKREDKEKGIVDVSEERTAVDCLKDGETLVRM